MKKLLKLVPRSALVAAVLVLAVCATALAVTVLFTIPADMIIVPGNQQAEVFIDPEATIPVTAVHWGDIPRGSHQEFIFYVQNTGVEDINASISITTDVTSFMDYSFTPISIPLSPGEVGQITFTADILPSALLGAKNWGYEGTTP